MVAKIYHTTVFLLICNITVSAQDADTLPPSQLHPIYIVEQKPSFATTSRNISTLTNSEMKEYGAQTLSDALASLPGVSQLTTGAISKPVIRGMYGNRLQVNVAGLRLEDQQWEDEHGLGLSDIGVERVELIKGPAALLFGADALGGVINVIEEKGGNEAGLQQNINLKAFSNTRGIGVDYGLKFNQSRSTFLLRAGHENHADYADGDGRRAPNTLFSLSNLKLSWILNGKKLSSENRFLSAYNRFGFIADSSDISKYDEMPRWNRSFEGSNHNVLYAVFSSKNTFHFSDKSTLAITGGIQSNRRQEQERSNRVDLNLWLYTFNLSAQWERQLAGNWVWTNGAGGMFQLNQNFGGRIIVPDARVREGSIFSYLNKKQTFGRMVGHFETGLRLNTRRVNTFETGNFNLPGSGLPAFAQSYNSLNWAVGQSLVAEHFSLKANVETGFRPGNLSELAANGLHEGTSNWYIGNPDMKVEQCLNSELSATWRRGIVALRGAVFRNQFRNYIYLAPTNEEYFGFTIYRYLQSDATLQGFEAGISLETNDLYSISVDYSFLDARKSNGDWLPFSPANRLLVSGKYSLPWLKTDHRKAFVSIGAQVVDAQHHIAEGETTTPAYWLLQAGAGISFRSLRILLSGRNLLNQVYNDHLSRLKVYGVRDIGRNIVVNIGWQF